MTPASNLGKIRLRPRICENGGLMAAMQQIIDFRSFL
jgi:hypothetical protein